MKLMRITDREFPDGRYLAVLPTAAMDAAMADQAPGDRLPSFMQKAHLDLLLETAETGEQDDIWLGLTYRIPAPFDREALARVFTRWVQRHGVMHGWFARDEEAPTGWRRYDLAADQIAFEIVDQGPVAATEAGDRLSDDFREACKPLGTLGYGFRAIEGSDHTVVHVAVDHSYSDGTSFFTVFYELDELYREETGGEPAQLMAVGDFMDFAQGERERVAEADVNHPAIHGWAEFYLSGQEDLGRFPMSVGTTPGGEGKELEPAFIDLVTAEEADRLDELARSEGLHISALLFAAMAHTARDLGGQDSFRFVNPVHTRNADQWLMAAGWFINVFPVALPLTDPEEGVVPMAHRLRTAFRQARSIGDLPARKVYEIVEEALGIKLSSVGQSFLLSYMDLRIIPGADRWKAADTVLVSRAGRDTNVSTWLFREADRIHAVILLPGTDEARTNVYAFYHQVGDTLRSLI